MTCGWCNGATEPVKEHANGHSDKSMVLVHELLQTLQDVLALIHDKSYMTHDQQAKLRAARCLASTIQL